MVDYPGFDTRVIVVSFLPNFVYTLGSPSHDYFFLLPFYFGPSDRPRVVKADSPLLPGRQEAMARLVRCCFERTNYFQSGCRAHLLQLLYLLARQFHSADYLRSEFIRQQERAAKLRPVFEFIPSSYAQPTTVGRAAALAKMSQLQFIKLFKKIAVMTLVGYVTHVRLSHALRLLKESGLTIAEVANEVGFCDQSYFDRRFKAAFGQTPRALRAKGRWGIEVDWQMVKSFVEP